jgi:hypothetical protein
MGARPGVLECVEERDGEGVMASREWGWTFFGSRERTTESSDLHAVRLDRHHHRTPPHTQLQLQPRTPRTRTATPARRPSCTHHVGREGEGNLAAQEQEAQRQEQEGRPARHQCSAPDQCSYARRPGCDLPRQRQCQRPEQQPPVQRVEPVGAAPTRCAAAQGEATAAGAGQDGGPSQAAVLAEDYPAAERLWQWYAHAGPASDPGPVPRSPAE